MPWRPDQLRLAVSSYLIDTPPRPEYVQVTGDAWSVAFEPFALDLAPAAIEGIRHLLLHVDLREVSGNFPGRAGVRCRATVQANALFQVRTMGSDAEGRGASVASWDQALAGIRHLWYRLMRADVSIREIETVPENTGYRIIPATDEWILGVATMNFLFPDSLEA
jgi:hypothetical protein